MKGTIVSLQEVTSKASHDRWVEVIARVKMTTKRHLVAFVPGLVKGIVRFEGETSDDAAPSSEGVVITYRAAPCDKAA